MTAKVLSEEYKCTVDKKQKVASGGPYWFTGKCSDGANEYVYQTQIYEEPSEHGIKGLPKVSKLFVYKFENGEQQRPAVMEYDRTWALKPKTPEHTAVLNSLVKFLSKLP